MKAFSLVPLILLAAAGASPAFGFAEFARGQLDLSTTARAAYDSRVFGGVNAADDYIFTLDPRLLYRRAAGQIKLEADAGLRINRYADFTEMNSEDLVTRLHLSLPAESAAVSSGSFESLYDEHTDVNYDVNQRIREKSFTNRLNATVPLSLKTGLTLGGSFRRDQRNHFSDRDTWDGTAGFRYQDFLGNSALDLRYRHLEVETSGGNTWGIPINQDSDSFSATLSRPIYHEVRGSLTYGYRMLQRSRAELATGSDHSSGSIFAVTIDGPFLPESMFPKVETSLTLGYQKTETPGINDSGGTRMFGTAHVGWRARERTRLFLDARRSQELSANDTTVEVTGFRLGVTESVGNFTELTASGGYEQRDFQTFGRTDDVYVFQAGANYRITRAWSAGANYNLRAANSNARAADYARHIVAVSANYTF